MIVTENARASVILFDGVCHLCNGFVQFVLQRDSAGRFQFAPLQSDFARARLGTLHLDSIALVQADNRVIYAEHAALAILSHLSGPWPWIARAAAVLPDSLLAWGYRLVAKHRYRLFGRDDVCMMPRPEWKTRFLT